MLVLGGGGYTPKNVARCWAYETAALMGASLPNKLPYHDFFEYYGKIIYLGSVCVCVRTRV